MGSSFTLVDGNQRQNPNVSQMATRVLRVNAQTDVVCAPIEAAYGSGQPTEGSEEYMKDMKSRDGFVRNTCEWTRVSHSVELVC
jgi:hypothetical protein